VTLRLPVDLVARVDALLPAVARDSDTATLLGGVSRSALLRLVIVEGMRVLELRYREPEHMSDGSGAIGAKSLAARAQTSE
jgi:hypothetical protein